MTARDYRPWNLVTRAPVTAGEFESCTHYHVRDDFLEGDMAKRGYGQVLFFPGEKGLPPVDPRECAVCGTAG
jgi:hypothetical protein